MRSPSAADAAADGRLRRIGRTRRVRGPLLVAGGVAAAGVAVHLRDPHRPGSWGICPLYAATGLYCPGCGGLRAVNDLTHGDLLAAASSNLLLFLAIPLLAVLWWRWLQGCWRGAAARRDLRSPYAFTAVTTGVLAVFSLARNLPFGSWLAP